MKIENETTREEVALKKEQAYIRQLLGVEENGTVITSPVKEHITLTCDKLEDDAENQEEPREIITSKSNDDYINCSNENINQENVNKCISFIVDLNISQKYVGKEILEKYKLQNLPLDLQKLLEGINQGLPCDYNLPIDKKPDWLDMKKFKIGQSFAQKYYFGLNYSEMLSLLILFAFPNGLEPLIFTGNSGTPFTAFRRYLSTALRVKSWFECDVWSEGNLGYKNLKAVRAMHLNVSKRLNSIPNKEDKSQLSLWGSSNGAAVWCPMKEQIQQEFQSQDYHSGCPFRLFKANDDQSSNSAYFNQLGMSVTQFGFVGLMVMYPDKFGAGSATEEELDGFIHLWRGLGYLLGVDDKYNFCNGTLEEVRQRGHYLIDNWAKPNFQHVTEDWEHMSRCLLEGISYYAPGVSFEVSLVYLCWVLNIPMPRLHSTLSWWQSFVFLMLRLTMTFTLRLPGMVTLHNWMIHRSLARAAAMSPEQLNKLESRTYDYQKKSNFNTRL